MAGAAMLPILAMVDTKPIPVCLKAQANMIRYDVIIGGY